MDTFGINIIVISKNSWQWSVHMFCKTEFIFKKFLIIFIILSFPCLAIAYQAKLKVTDNYSSIQKQLNMKYNNNSELTKTLSGAQVINGRFNESSCTGSKDNAVCVAVGFTERNQGIYPFLVKSNDGGKSFTVDTGILNFSQTGTLLTTACTSSSNGSFCVAGGYLGDTKENGVPLLIQSTDGGNSWKQVNIPASLKFGLLKKVGCTGNMCIAVGWGNNNQSADMYPILIQSADGGATWSNPSVSHLSSNTKGQLYSASCTGDGKNAMCVAIGNYLPYLSTMPMLIQTNDGGSTWINKRYSFYSDFNLTFNDVNCNGGNSNTVCTVVGRISTNDPLFNPVIYQTQDRGANWIKNSFEKFPTYWNGTFDSISCSGEGASAFCSVVGTGSLKPTATEAKLSVFPIVFVSSYADNWRWSNASINQASSDWNTLYSVNCINGANNFCFAAGFSATDVNQPILAVSSSEQTIWNAMQVSNLPTNQGLLRSTACSQGGSTCISVGYSGSDTPLLVKSLDGGISWSAIDPILYPYQPPPGNSYLACNSDSSWCVAMPKNGNGTAAVSYYSKDNEQTWIAGLWNGGSIGNGNDYWELPGFACGPDVKNCVAVGSDDTGEITSPVLLRTSDGGITWNFSYPSSPCDSMPPAMFSRTSLNSLTCDSSALNCTASGQCTYMDTNTMDDATLNYTIPV